MVAHITVWRLLTEQYPDDPASTDAQLYRILRKMESESERQELETLIVSFADKLTPVATVEVGVASNTQLPTRVGILSMLSELLDHKSYLHADFEQTIVLEAISKYLEPIKGELQDKSKRSKDFKPIDHAIASISRDPSITIDKVLADACTLSTATCESLHKVLIFDIDTFQGNTSQPFRFQRWLYDQQVYANAQSWGLPQASVLLQSEHSNELCTITPNQSGSAHASAVAPASSCSSPDHAHPLSHLPRNKFPAAAAKAALPKGPILYLPPGYVRVKRHAGEVDLAAQLQQMKKRKREDDDDDDDNDKDRLHIARAQTRYQHQARTGRPMGDIHTLQSHESCGIRMEGVGARAVPRPRGI